jgi:hypothetical protein
VLKLKSLLSNADKLTWQIQFLKLSSMMSGTEQMYSFVLRNQVILAKRGCHGGISEIPLLHPFGEKSLVVCMNVFLIHCYLYKKTNEIKFSSCNK